MLPDELEDRVKRTEYALWGLNGNNGLVSEVRGLRSDMRQWHEDDERKEREAAAERKRDIRWRVTTAIAIVGAILIAAGIVASAL
jgi:hypothetical protein